MPWCGHGERNNMTECAVRKKSRLATTSTKKREWRFFISFSIFVFVFGQKATENDGEGEWIQRKGDTFSLCRHTWAAASSSTKCVCECATSKTCESTHLCIPFFTALSRTQRVMRLGMCACVCVCLRAKVQTCLTTITKAIDVVAACWSHFSLPPFQSLVIGMALGKSERVRRSLHKTKENNK